MSQSPSSKPHLVWECVSETPEARYRIFDVVMQQYRHPHTQQLHDFVVLDAPDWVNVVALTPTDQVVLVQQFRYGMASVSTEIPGGMVDPGEEPLRSAMRELREETGYVANSWLYLGVVEPNPAFQNNRCWLYLALDAEFTGTTAHESSEVIEVVHVPLAQIGEMIMRGEITHALVICAFFHLYYRAGGWKRPMHQPL